MELQPPAMLIGGKGGPPKHRLPHSDWKKRWVSNRVIQGNTAPKKLVVLQQQDMNIPAPMKQNKTTLKITL